MIDVGDAHVKYCLELSEKLGHTKCQQIAELVTEKEIG